MLIAIIVAMSKNRVIGADGKMPWHLPADLARFKRLTMGQTLLMGRKTYESIGRPLPGRETIILSRQPDLKIPGCCVVSSLETSIAAVLTPQLFICGGGEIYRQALPLADRVYLTILEREVVGDTFFPELPCGEFRSVHRDFLRDAGEPCRFEILERRGKA